MEDVYITDVPEGNLQGTDVAMNTASGTQQVVHLNIPPPPLPPTESSRASPDVEIIGEVAAPAAGVRSIFSVIPMFIHVRFSYSLLYLCYILFRKPLDHR